VAQLDCVLHELRLRSEAKAALRKVEKGRVAQVEDMVGSPKHSHRSAIIVIVDGDHRIPDPPPVRTSGAGQATCKKPSAFRGTSGHSGSGRGTLALPAMAVPSSIDTGTPAPPDLLPLDPVSTHRNGTSLCRNPARDLIFTRGRHRRDNGLTSNYKVCRRRRPRPQLTP